MKRCNCADCVCLVEGNNGEWICDEVNKPVEEVPLVLCREAPLREIDEKTQSERICAVVGRYTLVRGPHLDLAIEGHAFRRILNQQLRGFRDLRRRTVVIGSASRTGCIVLAPFPGVFLRNPFQPPLQTA